MRVEAVGPVLWAGGPPGAFWVLPKRSIPKPDPHEKDIIQRKSLGADML